MDSLTTESLEVHDILIHYTKIHGDVFKTSIRRIIAIPGIFKAINYGEHHSNLNNLSKRLEKIILKMDENTVFATLFKQYSKALLNTIIMLINICKKLNIKSQGNLFSYSKLQYKDDINKYNMLIGEYKSLGIELNKHFKKV